MEILKLHAEGKKDHFLALKEKYQGLKQLLKTNKSMTDEEKEVELKKLEKAFNEEKKHQNTNLY